MSGADKKLTSSHNKETDHLVFVNDKQVGALFIKSKFCLLKRCPYPLVIILESLSCRVFGTKILLSLMSKYAGIEKDKTTW